MSRHAKVGLLAGPETHAMMGWVCWGCTAPLAVEVTFTGKQMLVGEFRAAVWHELRGLNRTHNGMPVFGLPDRARLHGREARGLGVPVPREGGHYAGSHRLPIYVYCPNCGRGQELHTI